MFLFLIESWAYTDGKQDNYPNLPFIAMKTADNKVVPWLASQTDMLVQDWDLVTDRPPHASGEPRVRWLASRHSR